MVIVRALLTYQIYKFLETITGPPEDNKQKAKDSACEKVLLEELDLTMPSEDVKVKKAAAVLSAPYALHQLMLKQNVSAFSLVHKSCTLQLKS